MGFTSGAHTSIATTTGSQCCLIMADKDGCISSQSTLCPILIQSVPNTPHTVDPFPYKPFCESSRFFMCWVVHQSLRFPPSLISSVFAVYYYTNA